MLTDPARWARFFPQDKHAESWLREILPAAEAWAQAAEPVCPRCRGRALKRRIHALHKERWREHMRQAEQKQLRAARSAVKRNEKRNEQSVGDLLDGMLRR